MGVGMARHVAKWVTIWGAGGVIGESKRYQAWKIVQVQDQVGRVGQTGAW